MLQAGGELPMEPRVALQHQALVAVAMVVTATAAAAHLSPTTLLPPLPLHPMTFIHFLNTFFIETITGLNHKGLYISLMLLDNFPKGILFSSI